jgi:uncharacterized membrane protein YheB (UPF0754 family)
MQDKKLNKMSKDELIENLKLVSLDSVELLDRNKAVASDFDKIKADLFVSYCALFKSVHKVTCETLTFSESRKMRQAISGLFTLELSKKEKSQVLDLIKKSKSKAYSADGKTAVGLWKETEETELPKGTLQKCLELLKPELEKLTEKQIAVLAKELTSKRLKDIK